MKFKESHPIYIQIADRICDEIFQGFYPEDGRIPSVREYAALVEVNVNTVVRTYEYLQSQEVIYTRRGLGYFVSPKARKKIFSLRKTAFFSVELPEFFRQLRTLDIPIEEVVRMYEAQNGKSE